MSHFADFNITGGVLLKYLGHESEVIIPSSLTAIGEYAFENCETLVHVKIPDTVSSIGKGAFMRCGNLVEIAIPEGVCTIEEKTFQYCDKLEKVMLPESLLEIKEDAFSGCYSLFDITIPENVQLIEKNALLHIPNINVECGKYSNIFLGKCNPEDVVEATFDFDLGMVKATLNNNQGLWFTPLLSSFCGAKTINGHVEERVVYFDKSKTAVSAFICNGLPIVVPGKVKISRYAFAPLPPKTEFYLAAGFSGMAYTFMDKVHIQLLNFESWEGIGNCYLNPGDDVAPLMRRVAICGTHLKHIDSITITPSLASYETIPKIIRHYPNMAVVFSEECFDSGVKISPYYIPFIKPTSSQIGGFILYQSGKKWESFILGSITVENIDDVFMSVAEKISAARKLSPKQVKSVFEWANDNADLISKDVIQKIIDALKSKKINTDNFESLLN